MSDRWFQFGLRRLFVVTLAMACFLGGWSASSRETKAVNQRLRAKLNDSWVLLSETEIRLVKSEAKKLTLQRQLVALEAQNGDLIERRSRILNPTEIQPGDRGK